jgi:hypothetical protein
MQTLTPAQVYSVMRKAYDDLIEFATAQSFQHLLDDLYGLPEEARPIFVNAVILNRAALLERGISVPDDILIQRSSFGDRRPTLFCIKKYIPEIYHAYWQNVNITFDNNFSDAQVPRDRRAWRPPLPIELQQAIVAKMIALEDIEGPLALNESPKPKG